MDINKQLLAVMSQAKLCFGFAVKKIQCCEIILTAFVCNLLAGCTTQLTMLPTICYPKEEYN